MFERFTERARKVLVVAQDEARGLRHNYIGTEHILLGLMREEEGLAAQALASLGLVIDDIRAEVARIVGEGDEITSRQIPFTPRSKKVLELSLREALSVGHNYIGTEHILLALVRENQGVAVRLMHEHGLDDERVRFEVHEAMRGFVGSSIEWDWRRLAEDIDNADGLREPSQTVLGLTLGQVADAVSAAQDTAITTQDLIRARELTKLRGDVLAVARWVETVLRQDLPREE